MKKEIDKANRYLVHNIRNSLVKLKFVQREAYKISLDIEKTLNVYRETIEDLFNENRLSNGKASEDE